MSDFDLTLVISHANRTTRMHTVRKSPLIIGRGPGSDIVLPHEDIAPQHVKLERQADGWVVTDLGQGAPAQLGNRIVKPRSRVVWHVGEGLRIGPFLVEQHSTEALNRPLGGAEQQFDSEMTIVSSRRPALMRRKGRQATEFRLEPHSCVVDPGERVTVYLGISNHGGEELEFKMQIDGLPKNWYVTPQRQVRLQPGTNAALPITFKPPKDSSAKAGSYAYRVHLQLVNNPAGKYLVEGVLTINPFAGFIFGMNPAVLRRYRSGQLAIQNTGNVTEVYTIEGRDEALRGIAFRDLPQTVEVKPGERIHLPLRVGAEERPLIGGELDYPFTITVGGTRSGEKTERGKLIVAPRVSLRSFASVVILLGLVAVLLGTIRFRQNLYTLIVGPGQGVAAAATGQVEPDSQRAVEDLLSENTTEARIATAVAETSDGAGSTEEELAAIVDAAPEPLPLDVATENDGRLSFSEDMVIGTSVNDRPIEGVRFGVGEKAIILVGGLNAGYAPSTVDVATQAVDYFDRNRSDIPEDVSIYIVITANPDSLYAPGEVAGRVNANGVDLLRNWDCGWEGDAVYFSEAVDNSGGSEPFSEPETQALKEFIQSKETAAVIFLHARADDGMLTPGNCDSGYTRSRELAELYALVSGYRVGDSREIRETPSGDAADWVAGQGIPSMTILLPEYTGGEFGPHVDAFLSLIKYISEEQQSS